MILYKVEEVSQRAELDAIVDCIWTVMSATDSAHKIFYPILSDRLMALNDCKERTWNEHTSDPSSHWVFIRDTLSSDPLKVLGACQWRFYEENPFPHGMPDIEATWWPEGSEGREFATEFVRQCLGPRARWMGRGHAGLSWCVVLPLHQRKGIGQAIMDWGLRRADELGLETYIEATAAGRKLYERCGCRVVARVDVDMESKGDARGKEWKALQGEMLPCGYDSMWRPVRGVWMEDEPQKSWGEQSGRIVNS